MESQTKKNINIMLACGLSISEISKSLELAPSEVSAYVRKFFKSRKQLDNLVKFPIHKTVKKGVR